MPPARRTASFSTTLSSREGGSSTIIVPHLGPIEANAGEVDVYRLPLRRAAIGLIVGGVLCAASFWAVYFLGIILAILALGGGVTQLVHSKDAKSVKTSDCCCRPQVVWKNLAILNACLGVLSIVGGIVSVISAAFHEDSTIKAVAVIQAAGCVIVAGFAFYGNRKAIAMETLVQMSRGIVPVMMRAQAPTTVVVSSRTSRLSGTTTADGFDGDAVYQGEVVAGTTVSGTGDVGSGSGNYSPRGTEAQASSSPSSSYAMAESAPQPKLTDEDVGYGATTGYGQTGTGVVASTSNRDRVESSAVEVSTSPVASNHAV